MTSGSDDLDDVLVGIAERRDSHGLVGELPVVASTIAELLRALIASGGEVAALPGTYGDAYEL